MKTFTVAVSATLALASTVSAALSLSSSCTSALETIAFSSVGACINLSGLLPLVTAPSGSSLVSPINSWLQGLCLAQSSSAGPSTCNNSTLLSLGKNITAGCGSDIEGLGLSKTLVDEIPDLVVAYYHTVVDAACTKANNSLCLTSDLNILQSAVGANITTSNFVSTVVASITNTTLERQIVCNGCGQAIWAEIRPAFNSSDETSIDNELNGLCGDNFAETSLPAGVIVATGTLATASTPASTGSAPSGSQTKKSGALSLSPSSSSTRVLGMVGSAVGLVLGGIAVLA